MTTLQIKESRVSAGLNKQIANGFVLYTKLHNFHWYVKGESFFTLHAKFEELYNETTAHVDELAERLLALGGKPVATLKESLALATIKEARGGETYKEMVSALVEDYSKLLSELKETMDTAAAENDKGTEDLLLGIRTGLEKHLWMLSAYLG
ncbi:Dps family protein [Gorillibacterium massiliense]|uniref:Dps family protein n=1 Tax=Gorillibacterium massiliense TaxID=1280390 RepID=UPI0004AE1097|nr:DNA starvation/stationary phase protection protein [Gorillibacterium massiliense]